MKNSLLLKSRTKVIQTLLQNCQFHFYTVKDSAVKQINLIFVEVETPLYDYQTVKICIYFSCITHLAFPCMYNLSISVTCNKQTFMCKFGDLLCVIIFAYDGSPNVVLRVPKSKSDPAHAPSVEGQ